MVTVVYMLRALQTLILMANGTWWTVFHMAVFKSERVPVDSEDDQSDSSLSLHLPRGDGDPAWNLFGANCLRLPDWLGPNNGDSHPDMSASSLTTTSVATFTTGSGTTAARTIVTAVTAVTTGNSGPTKSKSDTRGLRI